MEKQAQEERHIKDLRLKADELKRRDELYRNELAKLNEDHRRQLKELEDRHLQ